MTDDELAAIRERLADASLGPWFRDGPRALIANKQRIIAKVAHFNKNGSYAATVEDDANAKFIIHARDDIPALLTEVERLREIVQAVAAASSLTLSPGQARTTGPMLWSTTHDLLAIRKQARALLGQQEQTS